jgi:hypothetical protein
VRSHRKNVAETWGRGIFRKEEVGNGIFGQESFKKVEG